MMVTSGQRVAENIVCQCLSVDPSHTCIFLSHMRKTVDQWKMWFAGDGPVQYTRVFLSHMGRGAVDQWKMWFAGDGPVQHTRVFLSHMGRGTVDQWKMWFASDVIQYMHLSEPPGKGELSCQTDGS